MTTAHSLLPTAYLPPFSYFAQIAQSKEIQIEAHEHYQKGSYRNRCHIATSQGLTRLSIPLKKGKNQQLPIKEVQIAYEENWQKLHWNTIRTAYGNAPFFEHYAPHIEPFYTRKFDYLFDWNSEILDKLMRLLKLNNQVEITTTNTYLKPEEIKDGTDYRNDFFPKYVNQFTPKYAQVFEEKIGWIPDLSIIDALFCCGPQVALK